MSEPLVPTCCLGTDRPSAVDISRSTTLFNPVNNRPGGVPAPRTSKDRPDQGVPAPRAPIDRPDEGVPVPRGEDTQAARVAKARALVRQADHACKQGDLALSARKAKEALAILK